MPILLLPGPTLQLPTYPQVPMWPHFNPLVLSPWVPWLAPQVEPPGEQGL